MDFTPQNYQAIKSACQSHQDIEFIVPVEATGYYGSQVVVPKTWQTCPPTATPDSYAFLLAHTGSGLRGALTALELLVHMDGGTIHYRAADDKSVSMRISWPSKA